MAEVSNAHVQYPGMDEAWVYNRTLQLIKEIEIVIAQPGMATNATSAPNRTDMTDELASARQSLFRTKTVPPSRRGMFSHGTRSLPPALPYPVNASMMYASPPVLLTCGQKRAFDHSHETVMSLTKKIKTRNLDELTPSLINGGPINSAVSHSMQSTRCPSVDLMAPPCLGRDDPVPVGSRSLDDNEAESDKMAAALIMSLSPRPSPMTSPANSRMPSLDLPPNAMEATHW